MKFCFKYANLFEMDPMWKEPLTYIFQNYLNKVSIIDKAVSNKTYGNMCRIDDVVLNHKIDFIKMDIEGSELSAICGAKQTFCTNHIISSICSYH